MTTKVELMGRRVLAMRTKRLQRLIDLDAPEMILCQEAALIYKAACMINPQEAGAAIAKSLRSTWAYEKHLCLNCLDERAAGDEHLCTKCLAEIKAEADLEDPDDDPHASSRAPWKE